MIKVVLDTNILVSAFITGKGKEWNILQKCVSKEFQLFLSKEILEEFVEVMSEHRFGYSINQVEKMEMMLVEVSHIVYPQTKVSEVLDDPDDNKILECALESKAEYILTGDKHLLKIKNYKGINYLALKGEV